MTVKRNVRKVLKVRLAPTIVKSWFDQNQPQNHFDKLFQFLTGDKNAQCPQSVIERLGATAALPNALLHPYDISIAIRLKDARRLRTRLYKSDWYTSQIIVNTWITSPKF